MKNEELMEKVVSKVHHDLIYQPFRNVESENDLKLDTNENQYQIFTKSLKGPIINSQTLSKMRRITQEKCFQAQKESILTILTQKIIPEKETSVKSTSPAKKILALIERDNKKDIENPFVLHQ
jgi:hypothetical protein